MPRTSGARSPRLRPLLRLSEKKADPAVRTLPAHCRDNLRGPPGNVFTPPLPPGLRLLPCCQRLSGLGPEPPPLLQRAPEQPTEARELRPRRPRELVREPAQPRVSVVQVAEPVLQG